MKLTEIVDVNSLSYTGADPCIYWGERGFGVRVYPSGSRKYILSYRASGRKRLLTLGEYPTMSLDTAKDMAAAYRLQVREGSDPVIEKRFAGRAANSMPQPQAVAKKTVGALCDAYLTSMPAKRGQGTPTNA